MGTNVIQEYILKNLNYGEKNVFDTEHLQIVNLTTLETI